MMTAALMERQYRDELSARWRGGFTILAFLFSPPDAQAIRTLDDRGEYFDIRSGDTWDLFFPGYYRSSQSEYFESQCGASPVGRGFTRDWFFNAREFDRFRDHVERESDGRWRYSGETDLVLANTYVPDVGELTIDWQSTISGQLTDTEVGTRTMTLAGVIESLTRDLQHGLEDESYGVGAVVTSPDQPRQGAGKEFVISALAEITAAIATKPFGL